MKIVSLITIALSSVQAKLNEPTKATNRILDSVECTVTEIHGMVPPGTPIQVPNETYACTTEDGNMFFFDGDSSDLFGVEGFVSGETRLSLAPSALSSMFDGTIRVEQAIADGAVVIRNQGEDHRRKLTTIGAKNVLVVRVVSEDYEPTQTEDDMYNDVFSDDNNLRVRYDDCSNGALQFNEASGTNVNNGVLTVTTTEDLNAATWKECGNIAINGAYGISRDFIMIVCPNVVDFQNRAAFAQEPGSISWYRSEYASVPAVQMHEVAHNLGHAHSRKGGGTYGDPTCNLGNQGDWTDEGTNFCFNAAKTWANQWYSTYHATVDPSVAGYDGTLVGINAVMKNTIKTGQDVVLKISSSGQTDLYIIFNRKAGANDEVPEFGDEVVITEQAEETRSVSSWKGSLSSGEVYTQDDWGTSGTLTVKLCSLENGSPWSARVLVYATGQRTLNCDDDNTTPDDPLPLCQDGAKKFTLNGKRKNCKFVSVRKVNRCSKTEAAAYCPATCQKTALKPACACYDTEGAFSLTNSKEPRTCTWVANKSSARCRNNVNRSNCPVACGVC